MQAEAVRGAVLRSRGKLEPPPGYGGISAKVGTVGGKSSKEGCERKTGSQVYKIWRVGSEGAGELGGCPFLVDKLSKADRSIGMVLKE